MQNQKNEFVSSLTFKLENSIIFLKINVIKKLLR